MQLKSPELYFDPFANESESLFDPANAFNELADKYANGEIMHDYSADNFVKSTEALMLDAMFIERFDAVSAIATRMHMLCGENHNLSGALQNSDFLSNAINSADSHKNHSHKDHSEEDEIDPKTGKKTKKKKRHS